MRPSARKRHGKFPSKCRAKGRVECCGVLQCNMKSVTENFWRTIYHSIIVHFVMFICSILCCPLLFGGCPRSFIRSPRCLYLRRAPRFCYPDPALCNAVFKPSEDVATPNLCSANRTVTTHADRSYPFCEPSNRSNTTLDFYHLLLTATCSPNKEQASVAVLRCAQTIHVSVARRPKRRAGTMGSAAMRELCATAAHSMLANSSCNVACVDGHASCHR